MCNLSSSYASASKLLSKLRKFSVEKKVEPITREEKPSLPLFRKIVESGAAAQIGMKIIWTYGKP